MALAQFPLGPNNKGWDITKTPTTSTRVLEASNGNEYRAQNWGSPRWQFGIPITVLRQYAQYTEYTTLMGFILSQAGMFANWLYNDPFDNTATAQPIGAGTGTQVGFPLVRTIGGYTEPVNCANVVSNVYLNGTLQTSGWTVTQTGVYGPDTITFATAPSAGVVVSADFTFFFVCRFLDDAPEFNNLMNGRWENKALKFESVKQ